MVRKKSQNNLLNGEIIEELIDIVSYRRQVSNLISHVSKGGSISRWYPKMDTIATQIRCLNDLECDDINVDSISSLSQLCERSFACDNLATLKGANTNQQLKCLLEIENDNMSSTYENIFPTVNEVRQRISDGSLSISFHDLEGYNFSLEFAQVYRGKSDQMSAYEDNIIICKRYSEFLYILNVVEIWRISEQNAKKNNICFIFVHRI